MRETTTRRAVGIVVGTASLLLLLGGCITGERPRLVTDDTIPSIDDAAIRSVVEVLARNSSDAAPPKFTISFSVVTKFGGQSSSASISVDPMLGTSIQFPNVRFVFALDGTTVTCSRVLDTCETGINEIFVSDRMLNSRIFKESIVSRLEQDSRVAVGDSLPSVRNIAGWPSTCAAVPVVDSTGITREKSYCAFDDFGILAFMDTADLLIEATDIRTTVDPSAFATE